MKRVLLAASAAACAGSVFAGGWWYEEKKDQMTDEVTSTSATIESTGSSFWNIVVSNRVDTGVTVWLRFLLDAEVACPTICTVLVRADSAPPRRFEAYPFEGGRHVLRPKDEKAFITHIEKAKRILVQTPFTNKASNKLQGDSVVEFNTEKPLRIRPLKVGVKPQ